MSTGLAGVGTPSSWQWWPLKHAVLSINRGSAPDYVDDGPVWAVSQAANQPEGLDWNRARFHTFGGNPANLKGLLRPDDVLVNSTGRGTLGRVGYFSGTPDGRMAMADGHVTRVRVRREVLDPRYAYYYLSSEPFQHYIYSALIVGATNQIELVGERLASAPVPMPPIEEQRRIADFLDGATRYPVRLGEIHERLREVIKERRWSLFQRLVEEVQAPLIPLRRAIRFITDGPFGSAFSSSDYSEEGAAVVRLGNIGFAEYRAGEQAFIPLDLYRKFHRHKVSAGDLLIAGLGDSRNHAGRACVAPDLGPAIVKGKCFCARVNRKAADPRFLSLLLSSPLGVQAMDSRGSTRSMINLEVVKSAVVPLPNLSDQLRIARTMNSADEVQQRVVTAVSHQEAMLIERRQALITAAVTGQFDVTTASAVDA
ncbi:restriction endonuclease subunit S [Micromonospora sp. NPDC050686]|uniref:restriction endonuclease subunit S n=1 Tax=Micromonospora sp. NPDC050686 TaxID=3154631 RepID=UPI0034101087